MACQQTIIKIGSRPRMVCYNFSEILSACCRIVLEVQWGCYQGNDSHTAIYMLQVYCNSAAKYLTQSPLSRNIVEVGSRLQMV